MSLIDVVKYTGNDSEFVWKYPCEDLRVGTQLIVRTSQTAFFVKGGKIFDQFAPGTHTLRTGNIPLLNKLINLPFGGDSAFQAEVWFINLISKLDNKWGTIAPIQIEDPEYHIITSLRAFGQFGFKINDPRRFLETLVGTANVYAASTILEYFKGKLVAVTTSRIVKKIVSDEMSVLQINMILEELSGFCREGIAEEFHKYGIEVVSFSIMSINIPQDDPSVVKLKEAKELAMRVKTIGRDVYQMDRSFNVLDKAASNEGTPGTIMGAGMGLGFGVGIGNGLGAQASTVAGNMNTNTPAPLPTSTIQYHVGIDGAPQGPYSIAQLQELLAQGKLLRETLVWKPGMASWNRAGDQSDLVALLFSIPPPLPK